MTNPTAKFSIGDIVTAAFNEDYALFTITGEPVWNAAWEEWEYLATWSEGETKVGEKMITLFVATLDTAFIQLQAAYKTQMNCETIEEVENSWDGLTAACIEYAAQQLMILTEDDINNAISDLICCNGWENFHQELQELIAA